MTQRAPSAPAPDDVTAPWWQATRERRLLVQRCAACSAFQHPPRAVCTGCGRMEHLEFVPAAGTGVVDSWSVHHRSPDPDAELPYVIARVELEEGPILLTRLLGGLEWRIGDQVRLEWMPLDDGRALPVFRRAEE